MAFMPSLPNDPKVEEYCKDNLKVGIKIKRLLDEQKISTQEFHDALRGGK